MKKSDKTLYKLPHPTGWGSFFTAKFLSKQSFSLIKKRKDVFRTHTEKHLPKLYSFLQNKND